MIEIILLTIAIIGVAMLAMAVGVLFSNRCLRGSCGGPDVLGPDGEPLSCAACPRRRAPEAGADPMTRAGVAASPRNAAPAAASRPKV